MPFIPSVVAQTDVDTKDKQSARCASCSQDMHEYNPEIDVRDFNSDKRLCRACVRIKTARGDTEVSLSQRPRGCEAQSNEGNLPNTMGQARKESRAPSRAWGSNLVQQKTLRIQKVMYPSNSLFFGALHCLCCLHCHAIRPQA